MPEKCCPTCKQTLPQITSLSPAVKLREDQVRLFEIVRRAGPLGILSCDLADIYYVNDRNGGPLSGIRAIQKKIERLNVRLKRGNAMIVGKREGKAPGHYKLISLNT